MNSRRVLGMVIALLGGFVLLTAGGAPAHAVPDSWSVARFLMLLPALLVSGLAPGYVLTHRLRHLDPWAQAGLAVLVSCLVSFALGAGLLMTGAPLEGIGRPAGGIVLGLGVALAVLPARFLCVGASPGLRPGASAIVLALWVGLVAAIYLANPELRYRVDGWFHGAVAARVAQVGLPPDDPWFAGFRLLYFWAYHVVLDVTVALAPRGTSSFDALAGWACLAAFASGALLVSLGRAWARAAGAAEGRSAAAGTWALAFALLATNPLGWGFYIVRTLVGQDRGVALLARPFEEGASSVLGGLTFAYPHVSMASFCDKFLTPTAFGLGYAAFLAMLAALCFGVFTRTQTEGGRADAPVADRRAGARAALAGGAAILAGLLLHVLVGLAGLAALLLALVATRAVPGAAPGDRAPARTAHFAAVGALILALPYLAAVLAGKEAGTEPRLEPRPDMAWAILATGVVYLAFAARETMRGLREGGARRDVVLVVFILLGAALTTTMVQRNETKFVNLAFLGLALPAGAAAAAHPRRALLALAVALPTNVLAWAGFALDPGHENLGRRVPDRVHAEAYAWISEHTAPRDVFLEAQTEVHGDPDRDLLVHGPRPLVWGGDGYAWNWGYPRGDLETRKRAALEVATTGLSRETYSWLDRNVRDGGHEIYAVKRGGLSDSLAYDLSLGSPGGGAWTRVYANAALSLYRMERTAEPHAAAAPESVAAGGAR